VRLLDNDLNPCLDGTSDCRVYRVAPTQADPEIAYDGNAMVQYPTLLTVVMVAEDDRDLLTCLTAGQRPIEWPDVVERGRTVATLEVEDLKQLFEWAQRTNVASTRYRLVWCSTSPTSANARPWGQSWRLRVAPK
jgi:hypothetical protein